MLSLFSTGLESKLSDGSSQRFENSKKSHNPCEDEDPDKLTIEELD